jgi:hypothetical protein
MNNLIETRKKVYKNFPSENLNNTSSDIVLFYDINDKDYDYLTKATQNFLCKQTSYGKTQTFRNKQTANGQNENIEIYTDHQ